MEPQSNNWQKIMKIWVRPLRSEFECGFEAGRSSNGRGGVSSSSGSRSGGVSSSSGSPAPLAPLELGFSSGSANLKNKI